MALTVLDKIWSLHELPPPPNDPVTKDNMPLILIDKIFLHERTGAIALQNLTERKLSIREPEHVFCTMDHIVDTKPGRPQISRMPGGEAFIQALRKGAQQHGLTLFDIDSPHQGIVHVISPELAIVQPGLTLICPDSHTCTQGAFGALAWGVGSSETEHALVTKTLYLKKPPAMRVWLEGTCPPAVTAKDIMLWLIAEKGAAGAQGMVVEFAGPVVSAFDMEARMTLCNMAVEFGAFSALIAPDEKTFAWLKDRAYAPKGDAKGGDWGQALAHWRTFFSDEQAEFAVDMRVDVSKLKPMVSWGTSPEHAVPIDAPVPDFAPEGVAKKANKKASKTADIKKAQKYIGVQSGQDMRQVPIDAAFIGSCTNSRLADLRRAASILKGRKIADGVEAICVPGSRAVKQAAEKEGLDKIFQAAGFAWHEAGCSMCFYVGGQGFAPGARVITSTNRNFEGRQGPAIRSHLASVETVAASAIAGYICAPDELPANIGAK
ncbi:MAG: 3-isopropylmalate dehydratase large subunit [Alphaproteobacteria bacterium]|nr:3-isopropylmalate dehydratase large subunit [Alphaproteobacteria bacterium]